MRGRGWGYQPRVGGKIRRVATLSRPARKRPGNISIALLLRIAHALDFRIEWLVAEEDPWTSEIVLISSLLRTATRAERERVLKILDPENPGLRRARRIAFIGLRGAGKSTLGRLAAVHLKLPFLELNEDIEQASGMPVNELIALYGQEGYRHLERQSLERVVRIPPYSGARSGGRYRIAARDVQLPLCATSTPSG